jgi:hypothetical protein
MLYNTNGLHPNPNAKTTFSNHKYTFDYECIYENTLFQIQIDNYYMSWKYFHNDAENIQSYLINVYEFSNNDGSVIFLNRMG